MNLIINTCDNKTVKLILAKSQTDFKVKNITSDKKQSEMLLTGIDDFLKKNKIKIKSLKGIGVVNGPAGFSSVRLGVVCANTLAYALNLPVASIELSEFKNDDDLVKKIFLKILKTKPGRMVLPAYNGEPNITVSKK
ncbi:MAG: hypothetical protein WCP18_00340 [bacterium]